MGDEKRQAFFHRLVRQIEFIFRFFIFLSLFLSFALSLSRREETLCLFCVLSVESSVKK